MPLLRVVAGHRVGDNGKRGTIHQTGTAWKTSWARSAWS
ncbi:hypothetical protein SCATT_39170 [Streptantibioticus cattleyicolor NRRL 8057 = DSM 46488]|uniref:Uncharacterized protein n=1 Tax=Streptantibioticus cattleyicolor (strain ATCC 35852 / DSM 46488 / JCM 4925 / NBRC 14057 / NRRL 8057) TaxID=1003195 RepID=G8WSQ3_STREN|nr:hypothetical protein SCATT_39170 [Streptantibioticus cattleyicolor NRRL 8057 = DSM 46488]